ncbi:gamma-glutamyltransferase [Pusillimonas sp. CC-YST705]|uniref:Glutathione hydrolase proenzyme n=1 Tax=Mesopusillimonas faecipullorum TaxID=2755040 RepID=A0ABS8C9A2_9BURK|nr:gamma-glutamyltransferase [Mesopusillimonas faecipullorum]MCB5362616.1 gamma-glutamyltransferase [Mesopusillimonas faecipullorum]
MQDKRLSRFSALLALTLTLLCAAIPAQGADPDPEGSSGRTEKSLVQAQRFLMAAAHPLATQAGYDVLRKGGDAMDAAIAAQLMLNLVEPQSSGLGGGAFILYYDQSEDRLHSYDGRESAPAGAAPDGFLKDGKPLTYGQAVNSGLAVGVPGLARVLEMAHRAHGVLPWAELFEPAIGRAESGFAVTPRLHLSIEGNRSGLAAHAAAADYFLDEQGRAWPVGHILKNPAFAASLRALAAGGADALYEGEIAESIVRAVRTHERPGSLSMEDLAAYRAIEREPICGPYREYRVCGMAPPGGGLAVQQLLGILEHFPMSQYPPLSVDAVHYFAEAGRLAYADRDYYLADPAFVHVPTQALMDPVYLRARAALIQPELSLGVAEPGKPLKSGPDWGRGQESVQPSTSHLVAVDDQGNVVTMTTSIEAAFGSKIFVRGFLLNNELTDFSRVPRDAQGKWVANRVEPGKRPRSAMSPTMVFRHDQPVVALGAPGGTAIVNFVAQALVGVLDWGLDIQQAIALPHFGSRNACTELEAGTVLGSLAQPLRERGHEICVHELPSGLHGVMLTPQGLQGGADPRREGLALGD